MNITIRRIRRDTKRPRWKPRLRKKASPKRNRANCRKWICPIGTPIWTKPFLYHRKPLPKPVMIWTTTGDTAMRTRPAKRWIIPLPISRKTFIIIRIPKGTKAIRPIMITRRKIRDCTVMSPPETMAPIITPMKTAIRIIWIRMATRTMLMKTDKPIMSTKTDRRFILIRTLSGNRRRTLPLIIPMKTVIRIIWIRMATRTMSMRTDKPIMSTKTDRRFIMIRTRLNRLRNRKRRRITLTRTAIRII